MVKIVFATHNRHKALEVTPLLAGLCELVTAPDAGLPDPIPEDFDTLEQNSLQKASFVYHALEGRWAVVADDTGLEVESLGGAPGAFSARYAGPQCSFSDNVTKLLRELEGVSHRAARFRTVVTLIIPGGETLQFEGQVVGEILTAPVGPGRFGYDPVFRPLGYKESFAQMPLELKNRLSHRGKAFQALITYLQREDSFLHNV